jgi:glucose-1-phosphatase
MAPRSLFFDLGNVLLAFSHERMCRQIADVAGVSVVVVRGALFADEGPECAQWRFEEGRIDAAGYYEHFCERVGARPDRMRLEHAACDIFWPIDPVIDLVHRLAAAGNRLGILSNINEIHWQFVASGRFDRLQPPGAAGSPFQHAVLSFEVGAMKPDPRIYAAALAAADASPSDVFFVDDRPENVAGALAAGLDAVPFVGVDQLVADLRQRGVPGV